MTKKIVSLLLAVLMLCSLLPIAAFAEVDPATCDHNLLSVTDMSDYGMRSGVSGQYGWKAVVSPTGNIAYESRRMYGGGNGESKIVMTINDNPTECTIPVSWYRAARFKNYGKFRIQFLLDGAVIPDVGGDYTNSDSSWTGWKTEQITIPAGTHTLTFSVNKTGDGGWSGGNHHALEIPHISAFQGGACSICGYFCPHNEFFQNFDTEEHWLVCEDEVGCQEEVAHSRAAHEFDENGNCVDCAYSHLELVDGYYQIGNAQQLLSFENLVNVNHATKINGKLTADINMAGISSFSPIGTAQHPYEGTFDGQGHRIINLNLNMPETDNVGFIGGIRDTYIKNIVIDKSCSFIGRNNVAPLGTVVGTGASLHINCGNEADVTAMNNTAMGLAGNNGDLINCYATGTVKAMNGETVAGLTDKAAWMMFYNCYFAGELYVKGTVAKAPTLYWFTNYYDHEPRPTYSKEHSFAPNDDKLTDGTLLNEFAVDVTVNNVLYPAQYIAGTTHPILFAEPEEIVEDTHEHEYSTTYEWINDGTECNAVAVCDIPGCRVDGNLVEETVVARPSFSGKVEGSSIGVFTYTAEFENPLFTTQHKNKNVTLASAITSLYFSDVNPDGFTVSWDVPADAESFVVDIATDEEFENCVEGYEGLSTTEMSLTLTGLTFEQTYYCRVRSIDSLGVPSAAVIDSVTPTGVLPEAVTDDACIVLNHNSFNVNKLSIAYIGETATEINDWETFVTAGKAYTDINGVMGYKQYSNPVDGKSIPEFDSGYYAIYIRYVLNGKNVVKYQVVNITVPEFVEVTVNDNGIVLDYNDCIVNKLSIAFIGSEEKEINDWAAFVEAGKEFTKINGADGYKQYSNPADGKTVKEFDTGYYAVYVRYTTSGVVRTEYRVVYVKAPVAPEVTVSENNIVLNYNECTVNKMSIAFIGSDATEIDDWKSFEAAGKEYADINGKNGCTHFVDPENGKSIAEYDTGYYAVYIRYTATGEVKAKYQVVNLTAPVLPEVVAIEGHIGIVYNEGVVEKLSLAYIGTEEKTIKNWADFEAAGKEYDDVNGEVGCTHHYGIEDGKLLEEYDTGYYAAFIRYTIDGVSRVKYQVVYLTAKELPDVSTEEGQIIVNHNDFEVNKVSVAYIGNSYKIVNDWKSFVNAGKAYADINGKDGYKQYVNPVDGKVIEEELGGFYAIYTRYSVNGTNVVRYEVVYVEEKAAPFVSVDEENIVLDAQGFTVTKVSVAYIGTDAKTIKNWTAFTNAGKEFTDINGADGYKQYTNPVDGKEISTTESGYYAVYIRYTVDGNNVVKYQVVEL